MTLQPFKKTGLFPQLHVMALAGCSLLVLVVALWPSQGQSLVVDIPANLVAEPVSLSVDESPWQNISETVTLGDTLSSVFERSGAGVTVLYKLIGNNDIKKPIEKIYPGQEFVFSFDEESVLRKVSFNESPTLSYHIVLEAGQKATIDKIVRVPDIRTRFTKGTINNSLFLAGSDAGLSDNMIMQLATLFGWDIDFALDIRQGDQFSLLYEENFLDGEKLNDGSIVAAKFYNNGREVTAIRYTDSAGHTDYYSPDGNSMRKAFLRTPMDVFRISSSFNPNRKHPVLNKIIAHKGTDYAAPTGTPIKASGDGKIIKANYSSTYGNVVVIQHGANIRTLYAHMSKFSKYTKVGNRIKQGQVIGYVGATGRVTGAHLHYEFQVNGVHKNPQTVKLPTARPLAGEYRDDFQNYSTNMIGQLSVFDEGFAAAGDFE
ncbi:peptidoglycan DD-metalloendopeptidase family protein [Reinekea forsetii]|jgi:murein DD-endopeptidase MepM/ murein hydrolase activator NlpD|uniref:peptidoglycan DD-metalloendopeptidase family protein n=1 Tax=Reinekea forsetii TaxID=1336806 RepID=UPI002356BC94|nr:peptidoglycan DD-metalloendopeptidase family protein [Reinekea forsetii]